MNGPDCPALAEQLDAVGREGEGLGFCRLVATVGDADSLALLHCLDDQFQVFAIGGDVLQHDAMLQAQALADDVVDGQGGQHPVLHGIFAQGILVADVVAVAVTAVAVDVDAKDVLDGIFVAVEGGACQLDTSTHFRALPSLVDVAERDSSSVVDRVDQPDIFFEQGRGSHG